MRKALITCTSIAVLALPGAAFAAKPVDKSNAAKECKAERGTEPATQEAFTAKYGTNANGKNAFGKCVSQKTREEAAERKQARRSAAKDCRTERTEMGVEAFREQYGTNRNRRNAFGKCVSGKAKPIREEEDAQDMQEIEEAKNAAKECDAERTDLGEQAFAEKYGTNGNDKNAFGKCVSGKTHES